MVQVSDFMVEKIVIIGGGPAGLSAAIYASREGFEPLVIAGFAAGGQLLLTTVVENFPGFPEGIDGPEIIVKMREQAEKFGTRFVNENVTAVDFSSRPYRILVDEKTYEAETVIIATGADAMLIGLESEKKFMGRGVSSCATCDGPFYKGKSVIVVGGGDSAMEEALFLTRFASSVKLVHRRDSFRASKIMQEKVLHDPKISVIWNTAVDEIKGDRKVESVVLKDVNTGQKNELPIDGVFVAIGHKPNTEIFKGKLEMDAKGYLVTKNEVETGVEGVFVAGDVYDSYYRQAVTASAGGVKAALKVREYFANHQ
jgi:thioredoxin reductase (NADPH)